MAIELGEQRIQKTREIEKKFLNRRVQESKNKGSESKSSLWEELLDIPLECTDITLPEEFTATKKKEIIGIPDNLGLFLRNTAGNDLELAATILRYKQNTFDPIHEMLQRKQLLRNLIFLNGLRVYVNISKKRKSNPLKPDTETAFSNGLENFINETMYDRLLRDDIYGLYRFTHFPNPSGIDLNKKILLGRCLFCPRNQNERSYFCERHFSERYGSEKRATNRRINHAYNSILKESFPKEPSLAVKAYELHNWAKQHPIHKEFRDNFYKTIQEYFSTSTTDLVLWRKLIVEDKEQFELEKAYRSHPYSKELDYDLNFKDETLIDLFYSACLASEHALIKIAGNKDLRRSYSFSDVAIKEILPVL